MIPVPEAFKTGFVVFSQLSNIFAYFLAFAVFIYAIYFKTFNNKFLIDIGEISYSLYLLHMLSFLLVARFISLDSPLNNMLFLMVSAVLAFWMAKLSYNFVEYPAIRLGKHIIKVRNYA